MNDQKTLVQLIKRTSNVPLSSLESFSMFLLAVYFVYMFVLFFFSNAQ